jgi:hypothetical protein
VCTRVCSYSRPHTGCCCFVVSLRLRGNEQYGMPELMVALPMFLQVLLPGIANPAHRHRSRHFAADAAFASVHRCRGSNETCQAEHSTSFGAACLFHLAGPTSRSGLFSLYTAASALLILLLRSLAAAALAAARRLTPRLEPLGQMFAWMLPPARVSRRS